MLFRSAINHDQHGERAAKPFDRGHRTCYWDRCGTEGVKKHDRVGERVGGRFTEMQRTWNFLQDRRLTQVGEAGPGMPKSAPLERESDLHHSMRYPLGVIQKAGINHPLQQLPLFRIIASKQAQRPIQSRKAREFFGPPQQTRSELWISLRSLQLVHNPPLGFVLRISGQLNLAMHHYRAFSEALALPDYERTAVLERDEQVDVRGHPLKSHMNRR